MDVFEKLVKDGGPIGQHMDRAHGYFTFPKLEGELGPRMTFRGKECIVWSLNNYLGLVNHPEVRKADADAAAKYGMGNPMGARMMSGNTENHEKLEKVLSDFTSREDTMLLNFGYQGVVSCIDALVNRRDVIVYDAESHACIVDGVRLHMGNRFAFKHNDIDDCEKQLQRATELAAKNGGGILLITEGVFGMDGEQGILKEIVALKEKYEFRVFIDDAHGFGYMGNTGAGADQAQECQDGIDLYFSLDGKKSRKPWRLYLRTESGNKIFTLQCAFTNFCEEHAGDGGGRNAEAHGYDHKHAGAAGKIMVQCK